jgi:hypothetical protein
MGEMIWVEILSRHRDVAARYCCAGPEIFVGRAYTNEVVVDDPYVAPRHLRIVRNEAGALVAEDLGSANGLFSDPGSERVTRLVLDGDRPIRIGNTYLRIRDANHAIAPERVSAAPARIVPVLIALGAAILAIMALSLWLNETSEPKPSRYLYPLLIVTLAALGWTAAWATLSRVFSGAARFERNLQIALAGLLAFVLCKEAIEVLVFAFSWRPLATYRYGGMWCLVAVICFYHLREIGGSRLRLKGGIVAALAAAAITMQTLTQFEMRSDFGQQNYVRRLMPPALRLSPLESETVFFTGVERLKSKLDRDRTEEPSGGLIADFGFDD